MALLLMLSLVELTDQFSQLCLLATVNRAHMTPGIHPRVHRKIQNIKEIILVKSLSNFPLHIATARGGHTIANIYHDFFLLDLLYLVCIGIGPFGY